MRDIANWRGLPLRLFAAGIVLAVAAAILIRSYAPDPKFGWPASLFLLLCLPLPAAVLLSLASAANLRSAGHEAVAMAEIGGFFEDGSGDDNSPLYSANAVVVDGGARFRLRPTTYTDTQRQLIRTAKVLPIGYRTDEPGDAELRFDLIDLVVDRADPGVDHETAR